MTEVLRFVILEWIYRVAEKRAEDRNTARKWFYRAVVMIDDYAPNWEDKMNTCLYSMVAISIATHDNDTLLITPNDIQALLSDFNLDQIKAAYIAISNRVDPSRIDLINSIADVDRGSDRLNGLLKLFLDTYLLEEKYNSHPLDRVISELLGIIDHIIDNRALPEENDYVHDSLRAIIYQFSKRLFGELMDIDISF